MSPLQSILIAQVATSDENIGDEYEVNLSNNQAQFITFGPDNHTFVVYKYDEKVYIAQSWTKAKNEGFSFESVERAEPVKFTKGVEFTFNPGFAIKITEKLLKDMKVLTANIVDN